MALYTKKRFSALCGFQSNRLSVEITRGKIVLGDDDLVDSEHPTNAAYLAKFGVTPKPTHRKDLVPISASDDDSGDDEVDVDGINPLSISDKRYKHFLAATKEKENKLKELEIAKKQGQVIPSEFIKPLFSLHNQSILTEMKNCMDDEIRYIAKQFDIPVTKVAEIKGRILNALNLGIKKSKESTARGLINIVNNYAETK